MTASDNVVSIEPAIFKRETTIFTAILDAMVGGYATEAEIQAADDMLVRQIARQKEQERHDRQ